jgi:hypothetical protein
MALKKVSILTVLRVSIVQLLGSWRQEVLDVVRAAIAKTGGLHRHTERRNERIWRIRKALSRNLRLRKNAGIENCRAGWWRKKVEEDPHMIVRAAPADPWRQLGAKPG